MTEHPFCSSGIAGIALPLGLWPFGIYQASLMAARRLRRFPPTPRSAGSGVAETFAICLCAYNERAVIREKVEDMLRMREAAKGALDILVYVDAASDGTTEILEAYRDRIELHVSPERHGKTYGMNLLVSRTKASIIMFTDANVLIDPSAVAVLRRYFADPEIGCVCSSLTYVNTEELGHGRRWRRLLRRLNEWTKALETATGSVIGADGSLFAVRRRLHRNVPKGLFDDIYVSVGVLLQGYRVVTAPELLAFETHSTVAQDYRRKIRIACECMHVHFTLWPELRRLDIPGTCTNT